ncbi:hypothetical protein RQP46_000652 [Phenoliferia psychrophenolica]
MAATLPSKVGYVRLGNSGLKVSKVILGCMSYGNSGWSSWVLEEEESMRHFEAAWKLGINTWDTANVYSGGDSEEVGFQAHLRRLVPIPCRRLIGKAIKKFNIPREELVILTKAFMNVGKDPRAHPSTYKDLDNTGYVNRHGSSRKALFDAIKESLARMDLEYVDVFQLHRFDKETPIEETMDALHDIVKLGLARYIGMSSCYAYQFAAMQNYAKSKGQTMFISMQDFYNPIYREEEREMFPTLDMFGVGSIPWSPLARGYMTRPWKDQGATLRATSDPNFARFCGLGDPAEEAPLQAINSAVEKIAKARGYSMAQIALAWVLSNKTVSAPIIGSTKLESITELAQATHIVLTDEEIQEISSSYRPRKVLGH